MVEEPERSFAVVSAYRSDLPVEENDKLHDALRHKIKALGTGYIELDSGFTYGDTDRFTFEKSFMIPEIDRETAMELAKEFEQYSLLFKDANGFNEITPDGKPLGSFQFKAGKENLSFNKDVLRKAFSSLIKTNRAHRGEKFAFKKMESLHEVENPSWFASLSDRPLRKFQLL